MQEQTVQLLAAVSVLGLFALAEIIQGPRGPCGLAQMLLQ